MRTRLCVIATGMSLLMLAGATNAGGWDLITVKDFPDFAVAGKPLRLTFRVWVPSLDPVTGLHPVVRATNAQGRVVRASATATGTGGDYTAALRLPEPGDWSIVFDTDYEGAATMPPLTVIAPGAAAPDSSPLAARGFRLFVSKGCNGCHLHPDMKRPMPDGLRTILEGRLYGPDLTGRRFATDYLTRFLSDPSTAPEPGEICSRDGAICGSPYRMPNLNLTAAEIEALVAFITKK